MAEVVVIIPVRNDARRLERCLQSLKAGGEPNVEIVVADNGSVDDSPEVARRLGATVLHLPDRNVAQVRNAATNSVTTDLVAFVDADHTVSTDWLAHARRGFDDERIGAVGASYLSPPDGTWVQKMYGLLRGQSRGRGPTRWLGSGNMIVRRQAFGQVGGFDESLEASEDVDLCQRLRAAGWQLIADERLKSTHYGDPPTLGALFRAERWRGRNNIQVSLRNGLTWRDLPSVLAPAIGVAAAVVLTVSPLLWWAFGPLALWAAGALLAASLVVPTLTAVRMTVRAGTIGAAPQAGAVALVYHAARAAALIAPGRHHRR